MSTQWRGRYLEDFEVGDTFRSRLGRTITETDNTWFTCLTMNTNQMHFNREYAARTEFGEPLVVSSLSGNTSATSGALALKIMKLRVNSITTSARWLIPRVRIETIPHDGWSAIRAPQ